MSEFSSFPPWLEYRYIHGFHTYVTMPCHESIANTMLYRPVVNTTPSSSKL